MPKEYVCFYTLDVSVINRKTKEKKIIYNKGKVNYILDIYTNPNRKKFTLETNLEKGDSIKINDFYFKLYEYRRCYHK